MGKYLVKNLHGTSDRKAPDGGPLKNYWEKEVGRKASECRNCVCFNGTYSEIVGAHVKLVNGGNKEYIVPLCKEHNHPSYDDDFEVEGPLVPVNSANNILS
jgi:hypothetical protein